MTKKELRTLIVAAVEALKKSKGLSLELLGAENHGDLINFIILYDVPETSKIHKLIMSFHTAPLNSIDFEEYGVNMGKAMIKKIYTEIKTADKMYKEED